MSRFMPPAFSSEVVFERFPNIHCISPGELARVREPGTLNKLGGEAGRALETDQLALLSLHPVASDHQVGEIQKYK